MAEINIEKKRSMSPLIWMILLAVLAIAGYIFYSGYYDGRQNAQPEATAPAATTSSIAQPVNLLIGDLA